MAKTIFETERLLVREMNIGDLDAVATMLAHREVMQFFPNRYSRDEAVAWLRRQRERYLSDGFGYWLAIDRMSGEVAGQAGVMLADVEGVAEPSLGYIFNRQFWGRGLATEAARGCVDHAFDALGLSRVITLIRPENLASLRVARRLGLELEKRTIYARYEHMVLATTPRAWRAR